MERPEVEPLKPPEAKALAREIMTNGEFRFTKHAIREMAKDDLQAPDCLNLLRAGVFNPPEFENGEWRYRVETVRMCVVMAFESATRLVIVTAWRKEE